MPEVNFPTFMYFVLVLEKKSHGIKVSKGGTRLFSS